MRLGYFDTIGWAYVGIDDVPNDNNIDGKGYAENYKLIVCQDEEESREDFFRRVRNQPEFNEYGYNEKYDFDIIDNNKEIIEKLKEQKYGLKRIEVLKDNKVFNKKLFLENCGISFHNDIHPNSKALEMLRNATTLQELNPEDIPKINCHYDAQEEFIRILARKSIELGRDDLVDRFFEINDFYGNIELATSAFIYKRKDILDRIVASDDIMEDSTIEEIFIKNEYISDAVIKRANRFPDTSFSKKVNKILATKAINTDTLKQKYLEKYKDVLDKTIGELYYPKFICDWNHSCNYWIDNDKEIPYFLFGLNCDARYINLDEYGIDRTNNTVREFIEKGIYIDMELDYSKGCISYSIHHDYTLLLNEEVKMRDLFCDDWNSWTQDDYLCNDVVEEDDLEEYLYEYVYE